MTAAVMTRRAIRVACEVDEKARSGEYDADGAHGFWDDEGAEKVEESCEDVEWGTTRGAAMFE
eukprot:550255-Pyramimonas_sp.AAC.1